MCSELIVRFTDSFVKNGDRDKATLDVLGQVKNAQGFQWVILRHGEAATDGAQQVRSRNIQYGTDSHWLRKYHLKFVVRENQTGNMGSFETDINVPDLRKQPMKL